MELKDTIEMMQSQDFKERFKAEYHQTKIRYEKLHKLVIKIKAGTAMRLKHFTCPEWLLEEQEATMRQYLCQLEIRAEYEGIDLC